MLRRTTAEILPVVILYERLARVGGAMATYLHFREEMAEDFAPDFRLWRIDLALEPAFVEEAERDLAAAEVIILALDSRQPCPSAFRRWADGAGHGGGRPPHGIFALMETSDETRAGSWCSLLRDTATQIHSEVFVCDPPLSRADRFGMGQAASPARL